MGEAAAKLYDLEERTTVFSEDVIDFLLSLKRHPIVDPLMTQLVRSATSIGANYCEADDANTTKEFRYRISLSAREAHETKYFCRLLAKAVPAKADEARRLWKEADELNRILKTIHRKTA